MGWACLRRRYRCLKIRFCCSGPDSTAVFSTPLGSVSFSDVFNSLKLTSPTGVFAAFSSSSSTIFVCLSGLCALQAVAPSSSSSCTPSATPEMAISSFSFGLLIPLGSLIRLMSVVELSAVTDRLYFIVYSLIATSFSFAIFPLFFRLYLFPLLS